MQLPPAREMGRPFARLLCRTWARLIKYGDFGIVSKRSKVNGEAPADLDPASQVLKADDWERSIHVCTQDHDPSLSGRYAL